MIEIRFKSGQKVRPLLRPTIALLSLRGDESLIRIFRKRRCVQRERRARHDELGERLLCCVWANSRIILFSQMMEIKPLAYVQQFRAGKHTFFHARVEKVDVIA